MQLLSLCWFTDCYGTIPFVYSIALTVADYKCLEHIEHLTILLYEVAVDWGGNNSMVILQCQVCSHHMGNNKRYLIYAS